uniref:Uncharacterized protein n=1 Tax=Populus alba TaxID=43335 RepID=A0A4U5MBK1_POPAL|nr:hypothetical protein D5086_0000317770 [Populus alba]
MEMIGCCARKTSLLVVHSGARFAAMLDVLQTRHGAEEEKLARCRAGQAATGDEVEGDDWLLLTKDVPARCSRWSQVCRSAGHAADTILRRTNWHGAGLSRLLVPGEENQHGQGAVAVSSGFAKEKDESGLSLAKKGRWTERWNGDQR